MQDVLNKLDAEIIRSQARTAALIEARALVERSLREPVLPVNGDAPRRPYGRTDDHRRRVAEYLAGHAPARQSDVARVCQIPGGSVVSVLKHEWFQQSEAGWGLSDLGRAALEEQTC